MTSDYLTVKRNFELYEAQQACKAYYLEAPSDGRFKLYNDALQAWHELAGRWRPTTQDYTHG